VLERGPATSCVDRIDTIRLFLNDMDIWDDTNCNGLLSLRRLINNPCSNQDCTHSKSSPAAFAWLFPQLQPEINVAIPTIGRTFSNLIFTAMRYSGTRPLEKLVSSLESINTLNVIKWFSPAHFMVPRLGTRKYENSSKFLISRGLDMHIIADEQYATAEEYTAIRGQTPTTLAMRYSLSFFNYKNLLRSCNVDIATFVGKELRDGGVLRERGWTPYAVQVLFDLAFEPKPMPKIFCDHELRLDSEAWSFGRERCWEAFLARIKEDKLDSVNLLEVLHEIRQSLKEEHAEEVDEICYTCQLLRYRKGYYGCEDENSPVLFPTEYFL